MGRPRAKVKRGFGEVGQLPSGRYRARYTGPDGGRHSAPITFVARIDAEGWLVDQERMISRGEWEPPDRQVREVEAPRLLLGVRSDRGSPLLRPVGNRWTQMVAVTWRNAASPKACRRSLPATGDA